MDELVLAFAILSSLCVGAGVAWIILSKRVNSLQTKLSDATSKTEVLRTQNEMLSRAREDDERHHAESLKAQEDRFGETLEKVTAQMKDATDQMLKQRQEEFSASSKDDLGQIVTPLRETIDKMKQAMNENALKQNELSGQMKANLENMMRHSDAARKSADDLTQALRHGTKVQGNWGEKVLDELLQAQGLTRGVHYDVQATLREADGSAVLSEDEKRKCPDVILHLDQRRDVIIDSKVSLSAFMDYVNATDEQVRRNALSAHIQSLQKHVKELSKKNYTAYVKPPKVCVDYVIMFVPNIGALWTALNEQPDLWRRAMENDVFIADEQTLYAALRIINLTWQQIAQVENYKQVFDLADEMIKRVKQFSKAYKDMGDALVKAQNAYNEGAKKLSPSGQSILKTCDKLKELGAKEDPGNRILVPSLDDSAAEHLVVSSVPDGELSGSDSPLGLVEKDE